MPIEMVVFWILHSSARGRNKLKLSPTCFEARLSIRGTSELSFHRGVYEIWLFSWALYAGTRQGSKEYIIIL
jgi:hypothetical protein